MEEQTVVKKRGRPKVDSDGVKELERIGRQLDEFEQRTKELTLDSMNKAPVLQQEEQTKMSQREKVNADKTVLQPSRFIASSEKFNERYRSDYDFAKQRVDFIAENRECPGNVIELWTKPFPGLHAEFWIVPVNKPVNAPRYVAEQIAGCQYHVLKMDATPNHNNVVGQDALGQYTGQMVVKNTVNRLDAQPIKDKRSVFMGA